MSEAARSALERLTRPPVLTVFAIAQAVLLTIVATAYLRAVDGPLSAERDRVVTGDYAAFWTGATILEGDRPQALYDLAEQHLVQRTLVPVALPTWQPYVNPPLLATAVRPLVRLSYATGFRVFCAAMLLAAIGGALALVAELPRLAAGRREAATIALLVLGFHPMARTIFGGQNTGLTFALAAAALWALQRGRPWTAGLLLGALGYKPQFVILLLPLLLVVRAWQAGAAAALGCGLHYAIGTIEVAPDWPIRYLAAMRAYRPMEWAESLPTHFSIVPFFDQLVGGTTAYVLAALAIAGMLAALVAWAPRARPGDPDFPLLWSLVLVAEMLASPHLQFYDFGVLVLPAAIGIEALAARGCEPSALARVALAATYVGYPWLEDVAAAIGVQPLTIVTATLFGWLVTIARDSKPIAS